GKGPQGMPAGLSRSVASRRGRSDLPDRGRESVQRSLALLPAVRRNIAPIAHRREPCPVGIVRSALDVQAARIDSAGDAFKGGVVDLATDRIGLAALGLELLESHRDCSWTGDGCGQSIRRDECDARDAPCLSGYARSLTVIPCLA